MPVSRAAREANWVASRFAIECLISRCGSTGSGVSMVPTYTSSEDPSIDFPAGPIWSIRLLFDQTKKIKNAYEYPKMTERWYFKLLSKSITSSQEAMIQCHERKVSSMLWGLVQSGTKISAQKKEGPIFYSLTSPTPPNCRWDFTNKVTKLGRRRWRTYSARARSDLSSTRDSFYMFDRWEEAIYFLLGRPRLDNQVIFPAGTLLSPSFFKKKNSLPSPGRPPVADTSLK